MCLLQIHLPSFLLPRSEFEVFWRQYQATYFLLFTSRLISVAAITGHSPAGGCILALGCHQRVMSCTFFSPPQLPLQN